MTWCFIQNDCCCERALVVATLLKSLFDGVLKFDGEILPTGIATILVVVTTDFGSGGGTSNAFILKPTVISLFFKVA